MPFTLRPASLEDVPAIRQLIGLSVRELQRDDYTAAQREAALTHVYGVDTQLIADGTYYVVLTTDASPLAGGRDSTSAPLLIGAGGWSRRRTLFGGDNYAGRHDTMLDPTRDAAKIRAFFVHPLWARRGIATAILVACETAARAAGYTRLEMGATLTGVPFYEAHGYRATEHITVSLEAGLTLPIVRMTKSLER